MHVEFWFVKQEQTFSWLSCEWVKSCFEFNMLFKHFVTLFESILVISRLNLLHWLISLINGLFFNFCWISNNLASDIGLKDMWYNKAASIKGGASGKIKAYLILAKLYKTVIWRKGWIEILLCSFYRKMWKRQRQSKWGMIWNNYAIVGTAVDLLQIINVMYGARVRTRSLSCEDLSYTKHHTFHIQIERCRHSLVIMLCEASGVFGSLLKPRL